MTNKELSKKQEFDWEMKYKDKIENTVKGKSFAYPMYAHTVSKITYIITELDAFFGMENDKEVLEFLEDFQDVINWFDVLTYNKWILNYNYDTLERFNKHFDKNTWNYLSQKLGLMAKTNKRIRKFIWKYRESMNWTYLTKYMEFWNIEFVIKVKDYLDINEAIKTLVKNYNNDTDTIQHICGDFLKEHFIEILEEKEKQLKKSGRVSEPSNKNTEDIKDGN